ncbi:MAG TPA: DUF6029 family protein [Kofleriaceae bacterium]|nr:DUF6029 family protein [Kofleriaceae bacterium]
MRPRRWSAVLAAVLAGLAAPARGEEDVGPDLPVDVTATAAAGWHTDRDYGELFGRLNASSTWQAWHAALRVDTATFIDPPEPEVEDRYTLEKATAGWTGPAVEVSAGDAYVSFGRGLGLSIRKIDELGIDTTLRGARLLLHHGDLSATVAVGYANINNVDEATGTGADDPYDLIAGAQAQVLLLDKVNLGAYAAGVAFRDSLGLVPTDDYSDRTAVVGVIVDAPRLTERFGFYLEGVEQELRTEPAAERPRGFGLYGTATGNLEPVTLLVEGKAYGALTPLAPNLEEPAFAAVAYNSPPTVERVQQVIENPATEIAGARLRAEWTLRPGASVHGNAAFFRDWLGYADPESGDLEPGSIVDPYAGAELRWDEARSWVIGSAGWRAVLLDGAGVVRRDAHAEIEAAQALDDRFSVTLQAVHLERRKRDVLLDERFREGTLLLGLRVQPSLTVAAGYDYTTEPVQPHTHYLNGQLGWDFTPSSGLRLFAGSARGGLKCVSGVCRQVPPFEGVKLTATVRF